ncbi:hypothetical protein DSO57_1027479 [Entomophthora muscae]|uniref:Uncharacterized protein n=1 Tax=Entomophthora muscae TaxID=34485 RepID=A0ACC2T1S9_9FUNG|nr:hypothetical protein DSO57_1027479 [Entomophthora muscae]
MLTKILSNSPKAPSIPPRLPRPPRRSLNPQRRLHLSPPLSRAVKFRGPLLALDWDVFPRSSKKVACVQAKPLQNLEDLAHTVDKRFVLAFPAEVLISPLESPPTAEETLIWLDCLLS